MALADYRLLAPLGAGKDGIAYRAEGANERAVEVHVLGAARADGDRWPGLARRLRQATLVTHPAALKVIALALEEDPPGIVLEPLEGSSLAEQRADKLTIPPAEAALALVPLAGALTAAHRLGLSHDRLDAQHVFLTAAREIRTDFTGIDTRLVPCGPAAQWADTPQIRERPGPAWDVYCLGVLLAWLVGGLDRTAKKTQLGGLLEGLLHLMLAADPAERPSARDVEVALAVASGGVTATGEFVPGQRPAGAPQTLPDAVGGATIMTFDQVQARERLGRFRLLNKLGEGGMGAVYRAEDLSDGNTVAVKVLRDDWARRPQALRRFHKEARLLAEVRSPYVANLLEVNEDAGIHYLALEFVEGKSLARLLHERGRLPETEALRIAADVARALVDAHERGIVHRDIKPDNILLQTKEGGRIKEKTQALDGSESSLLHPPSSFRVKLADFGLARHVIESESLNLTQTGAILGTPLYMAPEQASASEEVDARTDVYSLGATLFHLLAGRPPFVDRDQLSVLTMHRTEAPPPLRSLNPAVSEAACRIVEKCLAKSPEARYANAGAMLHDLERLLRGEPTSIAVHPRLPPCDPDKLIQYDWTWDLEAAPHQLWPYISNTNRLNRAVDLPAVQFTSRAEFGRGVRRFGQFRKLGITAVWEEHPFEWVEARRLGVLREFSQGPFEWVMTLMELAPRAGGGTRLMHRSRIAPRGWMGRTAAAVEIGLKARRAVDRVYRRIDAVLMGKLRAGGLVDPFEEPPPLSAARRRRLEKLLERLTTLGVDPLIAERLGDFLLLAPPQEAARIRPLALARRLALDPDQTVAACLYGAREGLLIPLWDILCPVCRIPSEIKDSLKAVRDHGRCEVCNLDFEQDFAGSVELIFRAHPEIRESELGTYCVGGPSHSPHVVAQVRVGAGERIELDLMLGEGAYRLRGPQLGFTLDFRVEPGASARRWDIDLARGLEPGLPRNLRTGGQHIVLSNGSSQELLGRVERTSPRDDALTAARASALALFRELFPGEVLSPGQLVSVANITLLVTALQDAAPLYRALGDARAFGLIHEHFRLLEERIKREGGALVKTMGEGMLAVFTEPVAAVRAGLELPKLLTAHAPTRELRLKLAIHRGPAMAATLNDHLDYFGTTVNTVCRLPEYAESDELALTPAVAADPEVAALLQARALITEIRKVELPGEPRGLVHLVRIEPPQA
jgi:serine/threonine protein kinase/class 3 adenylate cyclase